LLKDQAKVLYHDPFVPQITLGSHQLSSVDLDKDTIHNADLVLILTDHSHLDYKFILANAKAVLDTRGITRNLDLDTEKVVLL
jgi:UDP-N-acetyl-D-glucosamine dehydrogenase